MTENVILPGTTRREDRTMIADLNPDDILDLGIGQDVSVITVTIGGEPVISFCRA